MVLLIHTEIRCTVNRKSDLFYYTFAMPYTCAPSFLASEYKTQHRYNANTNFTPSATLTLNLILHSFEKLKILLLKSDIPSNFYCRSKNFKMDFTLLDCLVLLRSISFLPYPFTNALRPSKVGLAPISGILGRFLPSG